VNEFILQLQLDPKLLFILQYYLNLAVVLMGYFTSIFMPNFNCIILSEFPNVIILINFVSNQFSVHDFMFSLKKVAEKLSIFLGAFRKIETSIQLF